MTEVYFGLGSNIGNKEENIHRAVHLLEERTGKLVSLSALYITEPEGFLSDHLFINAVCIIQTFFSPLEVLDRTEQIEREMGRVSKSLDGNYKDRLIDIDLLLYDDLIFSSSRLIIPHPHMTDRMFVIQPLAEIAPEIIIPGTGSRVKEILTLLSGKPHSSL